LLGLFLIFIGLMFLVQSVISSTQEVKESDLRLPPRQPDYVNEDEKDPKFNTETRWMNSNFKWNSIPALTVNGEPNNDLVSPFQMAACPHCSKLRGKRYTMLIPMAHFNSKDEKFNRCPECGVKLLAPLMINIPELEREFFIIDNDRMLLETHAEALYKEEDERIKQEEERVKQEEERKKQLEDERIRQEEERIRQEEEERNTLEKIASDLWQETIEEDNRLTEISTKLHQEEEAQVTYEFTRLTEISAKLHQEEETQTLYEFTRLTEISAKLHQEAIDETNRMQDIFAKVHQEEAEKQRAEDEKDRDDDGLPNDEETKYGMNPDDPNDIRYDNDGDGFTNLFEIQNGFRPDDPKDHPPLWWRLQIKAIRRIELPIKFMALNDNASSDKSTWLLQFNYPDPRRKGRMTSAYRQIGNTLEIDGRPYRIEDVERIVTEKERAAGNLDEGTVIDKIDESRVTMVEVVKDPAAVPDKLVMVINKTAYSNDMRPALVDGGNIRRKTEKVLKVGENITLGLFATENKQEGGLTSAQRKKEVRTYQLKSVDAEKLIIHMIDVTPGLEDDKKSGEIVIQGIGKVPANLTPIKKVENSNNNGGGVPIPAMRD